MAVTDTRESPKPNDAMVVEFRPRDYAAEAKAHSLPRFPTHLHPLSSSPPPPFSLKDDVMHEEKNDMLDPLRASCGGIVAPSKDSGDAPSTSKSGISGSNSVELLGKEWTTFKRFLVQKFPPPKTVAVSSIAKSVIGSHKAYEKSSNIHPDELDDPQASTDEDVKFITQQEYAARLSEMKNEILSAWDAGDHFKSLKLSVKAS